ncbi:hypothetical protein [Duganella sp. S19_KUP01_CR8]|uniref:hypothetical protein n=1 Tax=Duganella sp. S19_KUP01_CR8 TaxID=3025502 RepID=UPI002FCDE144
MLRTISILSITALLAACGGGGGSSTAAPGTPAPNTPAQASLTPTVGDFYSYKQLNTNITPGAAQQTLPPSWYTDVVNEVEADGSWTDVTVGADSSSMRVLYHYQANGDNDRYVNGGCIQNYGVTYSAAKHDFVVGAGWTSSTAYTRSAGCTASYSISNTASINVLALESVTVPAGTFNTVKVAGTRNFKYASGTSVTTEYTSWLDVGTHRIIKYSGQTTTLTGATGKTSAYASAVELQGYSQAKTGASLPNVERFAGPWTASYTGAYNGHCSGYVTTAGVLTVGCDGGFNIQGNIDAKGNATLALYQGSTGGPQFSGSLDTALSLQGTWKFPDGTAGSWTLIHL